MADEPTNTELLETDEQGRLLIATRQPDGTTLRSPATAEQALAFVDRLVAAYGADNVPVGALTPGAGAVLERVLTRDELVDRVSFLVARLRAATGGDDAATITALRGAVVHPKTIQAIAEDPRSARATLLAVWPDLDAILAWRPTEDPGGVPGGTGAAGTGSQTALAEAGGGAAVAGPLPELPGPPQAGAGPSFAHGPPPGGAGSATDAARAGDPVLPFSGQLLIEAVDLELEGIGLDVRFARTYLHATGYQGPLGPSWDHSYNLWLRERVEQQADGRWVFAVYRSTGSLGAQRFVADERYADAVDPVDIDGAVLRAGDANHDRLVKANGRYRLESPDGLRIDYSDELRAERLRDRNGNEIRLVWEGEPLRLVRLIDTCGRVLSLRYDDRGLLTRLRDEALGRELRYGYDADGRLERVLRTLGPGRPLGLVQAFRCWGDEAPPGLQDNVVAILDGRGREVLQVRYGDEPGLVSFNRVVEQRDGGVTRYAYGFVAEPSPDAPDDPLAAAVLRVETTLPDGPVHVLDYNVLGRLVRLALQAVDEGGVRELVSRWRYSADGRVLEELRADGSGVEYAHGRELFVAAGGDPASATAAQRARFGELRRIVERPRPGLAGPPLRVTEFDYHPDFALVSERRGPFYADALGHRVGGGAPFAVRVTYDARGNVATLRHPDCARADGSIQTGLELRLTRDARGRLVRREVALEDGTALATTYDYPPAGDPASAHPVRELRDADGLALAVEFVHDAGGRLVRAQDPAGLVEERVVDHAGRLERVDETGPDIAPRRVETEWAPHDVPVRTLRTRAGADGVEQPWAELTERFAFDADGDICESVVRSADGTVERTVRIERDRARRVALIDEEGVTVRTVHDARGLVVRREIGAAGVPTLRWRLRYDAAGRVTRTFDPAGDAEELSYDGFGRVAERRMANGSRMRMEWDASDRLVRSQVSGRHPDAPGPIVLHEERRAYDEGGRLVREETAVFDPPARAAGTGAVRWARRTYVYDRADRVLEIRGPGPLRQRFAYDGLGRVVRAEDQAGTLVLSVFDDAATSVAHEIVASGPGRSGPVELRLRSFERFDARGRVVFRRDGLGNETTRSYDSDGNLVATVDAAGVRHEADFEADGALGEVRLAAGTAQRCAWRYLRDARRRLVAVDGPAGRVVGIDRDAVGRVARILPAGGGGASFTYDAAGRLGTSRAPSGIALVLEHGPGGVVTRRRLDVSGRVGPTARDALTDGEVRFEHDGLGRMVLADDGVVPVARRFDSRGLTLSERTGKREVRWEHGISGAATAFVFSDGRRLEFRRAADGRLRRVVERAAAGAAVEEVARLWPLGLGVVRDVRWRTSLARRERRDAAGRLLAIDMTHVAGGARVGLLEQLADARGLPAVRRLELGGARDLSLLDVDDLARIVRELREPGAPPGPGVDALDVAAGAAVTQADVDAAIAQARAAAPVPAPEEIELGFDPDGARRVRTRRTGGAVVATTSYVRSASGLSIVPSAPRVQDADGLPSAAAGAHLSYDGWERVASAAPAAGPAARVQRDALGRPWRLVTAAGDVELVHDGIRPVEAHGAAGAIVRVIRAPGSPLVLEIQDGARRLHPLSDPDGTTLALLDTAGAVLARSGWDPWGERRAASGAWPALAEAFHGMPPLTGSLLLAPVRTYDAATGAYLEADRAPLADGPNLHAFARGNPAAFTDPLGFMAQAGGATGRGATDGAWYGHGTRRPDTWYLRSLAAMGGALWSLQAMVTEPVKQLYDLGGGALGAIGAYHGVFEYEHRYASGIGQLAESGKGTLDIAGAMASSIAGTPGRIWDAAERGDYAGFGSEAMNGYLLAKPAASIAGRVAFNRGVNALGGLGDTGQAWRNGIRTWQVQRLARQANRIHGLEPGAVEWSYSPTRAWHGEFNSLGNAIQISESAFTPSLAQMFMNPSKLGGVMARQSALARLHFSVDNALRGNLALRTAVHERWHAAQFERAPARYLQFERAPEAINPLEWTQPAAAHPIPGIPWAGAYNIEAIVPFTWMQEAAMSGTFTLSGAAAAEQP